MRKFYCPKCKLELNESDIKLEINSDVEDKGNGSPTFYKKFIYYCVKHNPPQIVEEVK